ncbi:MAG: LPS assembly protein LptD [Thermomonas hydrothermalis]|uniref:LPS assembly protein LptD n=1 Tax=Thermomonas hydrothermalis TaxID=213588 RepID=UPI00235508EC|nr:LPS assembly protein LptD [Thermomonas hydrothermalis]MCL6620195.1 LPS assembly protein LptD [Thermomonas hydrothermalis]
MRFFLRLLPLPLCIAATLDAHAQSLAPLTPLTPMAPSWALCPVGDVVPPFPDFQRAPEGLAVEPQDQASPAQDSQPSRKDMPTEIDGDLLSGTSANPVFRGNVTMRHGDQFMGADQLTFDKAAGRYQAEGSVRFQANGLRLRAARAEGDQNSDTHTIQDLQYQLLQRRGNGKADSLNLSSQTGSLRGATYSTCPPQARHWELKAQRIDVNNSTGWARAYGARLHVGNVPVLYLPFFMFPTDERRRSGLLLPSISNSGRNGLDWAQPIYLNLAPNYDATLTPRIMTSRGSLLMGQFRYLHEQGRGILEALWMPQDRLRDRSRGSVSYDGVENLSEHWQARTQLAWISDPRYLEDFSGSLNGLSYTTTYSSTGLYGIGHGWRAGVSADHWQLADYTLSRNVLPYDRLPRAFVHWQRQALGPFTYGLDAEAVRFHHPIYPAGARLDVKPWVSAPLEGDAWFLRPSLAWRYTSYALDRALAQSLGSSTSPSRAQSIFSLDAGVFFDRDIQVKGRDYLQSIEPRLFYLNVPYVDQTGMPVFDTQPLTFSWEQLFRDNRYSGGDRQADANQLTLAVSTRMIRQSDGFERFSASLGQIRYFRDSLVRLPNEPITQRGGSAWVVDANYAPTDRWTIGTSYQRDAKFKRTDLASLRARYLLPDSGVVNIAYRYRRAQIEQVDFSFLYPLNASWSLVGREYYSLRDNKTLEGLAGVQWDSCCVAVRVVARRYVQNRAGQLGNSLMFEIELKGLGSAGQNTQQTLRRSILGYNRDDLYLVPPKTATGQPSQPAISDPIP